MGGVDPGAAWGPNSEGGVNATIAAANAGVGAAQGAVINDPNAFGYVIGNTGVIVPAGSPQTAAAIQADYNRQTASQQVAQQAANSRAAQIALNEYGGVGSKDYGPTKSDDPFFGRSDIYKVTDSKQQALMDKGLTQYQAAEQLRYEAQQKGDRAGERYYETRRTQAWTTATGKSAAYHFGAKESGLAQAANPYENYADLLTYAEKGYPQQAKDRFSPVDYMQLGLPGGRGGQAYIWGNQNYDLRGAADVAAYALRSGDMGPYGNIPQPYSSAYGTLSLEDQQSIGRYVNENPINQAKGFITKDTMGGFTDNYRNMDRGTFVPTMGAVITPDGGTKKPFISALATETTVNRPSDATLSAMSMWGGENSNPIARGMVTMFDFLTPGTKTTTKTLPPKLVSRQSVFNEGGAAFTAKFIGENGKPTDVMEFKTGTPYSKDGKMYQDYERVDLKNVWVTPSASKTVETPSGFQRGQNILSDKAYNWLGGRMGISGEQARAAVTMSATMQREITNANPSFQNLATNMGIAEIKETFDKPAEAGIWFGVGLALGGTTRVAETGYTAARASVAERVISEGGLWRKGIQTTDFLARNLPKGMAGLYAIDVAGRSTDWGTNFKAGDVSAKGSVILTHEAIPMAGGTVAGYYAPELATFAYRSAVRTPGKVSDAIWTTRQRMAGIERVEPGTTSFDYTVTGKPVYEAPRSTFPSSSPTYDNAAGVWSWGGVRTKTGGSTLIYDSTPTVDVTPTVNLDTGQWLIVRPNNIATPAEQAMVIEQFRLSPGEIALAKRQGLSLNDILFLREESTPSPAKVVAQRRAYDIANNVMEIPLGKTAPSSLFGHYELKGNNLVRQLYPAQEEYAITIGGQKSQQVTRPLFGQKELVGNNLIRQLYPPKQKHGIKTIDLSANAHALSNFGGVKTISHSDVKNKAMTTPISGTRGLTLPRSDMRITTINTDRTISLTRQLSRSDIVGVQGLWARGLGGVSTGGKGGSTPLIPIIPLWGGSGGAGWGSKKGRGRKLTQVFTVSFGDVTTPLFSSGLSTGMKTRQTKKKRRK